MEKSDVVLSPHYKLETNCQLHNRSSFADAVNSEVVAVAGKMALAVMRLKLVKTLLWEATPCCA